MTERLLSLFLHHDQQKNICFSNQFYRADGMHASSRQLFRPISLTNLSSPHFVFRSD